MFGNVTVHWMIYCYQILKYRHLYQLICFVQVLWRNELHYVLSCKRRQCHEPEVEMF